MLEQVLSTHRAGIRVFHRCLLLLLVVLLVCVVLLLAAMHTQLTMFTQSTQRHGSYLFDAFVFQHQIQFG